MKKNIQIYLFILICVLFHSNSFANGDIKNTETVTDIDGNVYHTVAIGTQVWMVENLKTTKYRDGTAIPNVTENMAWRDLTTGAYCNFKNDTSKVNAYGCLYNWYAVSNTLKIAPAGWHVPTIAEWNTLVKYLSGKDHAGSKLKETGTTHWLGPNDDATNSSGFSALPGGYRYLDGSHYIGSYGYWWSSTEFSATNAWNMNMYYDKGIAGNFNYRKNYGFSVRCLKDK